ncbi:MAG: VWA domain-containing protein, partial [Thermoflexales bacterium]|nr:VWA domain-containing protein [Thermoflexales bacterium]
MRFEWPFAFAVALPLLVIAGVLYARVQRQRALAAQRAAELGFAPLRSIPRWRQRTVALMMGLGLIGLVLAAARPVATLQLPRLRGIVLLVFDVSGSMAADDVKPSRMDAAKSAARAFIASQPETVEIGIVAFSEGGLTVQMPTTDKAALFAAIDRLQPTRGTSLASGILGALRVIDAAGKVVVDAIPPARYGEYIGEAVEPWTYLKFPYYKP